MNTITIHEIKRKPMYILDWEQAKAREAIKQEESDIFWRHWTLLRCNSEGMLFIEKEQEL